MGGEPATVLWKVAELFKTVVMFSIFLMNDGGSVIKLNRVKRRGIFELPPIIIKLRSTTKLFLGSLLLRM